MADRRTRRTLLERLKDPDDDAAWRTFDAQYRGLILGYARRRGLQWADAEDVRQRVMLALAERLPRFRYDPSRGRFRDYLGVAVRNAVGRHLVRGRPLARLTEAGDDLRDAAVEDDVDAWEHEWMLHHYRMAMRRLRADLEDDRAVLLDALLGGAALGDIARDHGSTLHAVSKFKRRVRDRLRALVEQQLRDEEFREPSA